MANGQSTGTGCIPVGIGIVIAFVMIGQCATPAADSGQRHELAVAEANSTTGHEYSDELLQLPVAEQVRILAETSRTQSGQLACEPLGRVMWQGTTDDGTTAIWSIACADGDRMITIDQDRNVRALRCDVAEQLTPPGCWQRLQTTD